MAEQHERAFQKQDGVFIAGKPALGRKARNTNKKYVRYHKEIGLGIKTPQEAINGNYIDKKCPFTGNVSIRGRMIRGVVVSTKMQRTLIVRRDYLHYIKKYNRFEKRHKNIPAHVSPAFRVREGDVVTIGQCRPLSKTVRFNVVNVTPQSDAVRAQAKKTFRQF